MGKNIWEIFVLITIGFIFGAWVVINAVSDERSSVRGARVTCLELEIGKDKCNEIFGVRND